MQCINRPGDAKDMVQEVTTKTMIVLHGTAGGTAEGANAELDKVNKINVHYVIERSGIVYKRVQERYWAYHTGTKATSRISIGIELVNWCNLTEEDGKYLTWTKKEIPPDQVVPVDPPFRGVKFYQKLTDTQILVLKELIDQIKSRHPINKIVFHSSLSKQRTDFPPDFAQLKDFLIG